VQGSKNGRNGCSGMKTSAGNWEFDYRSCKGGGDGPDGRTRSTQGKQMLARNKKGCT
jgi:hypothetical protein